MSAAKADDGLAGLSLEELLTLEVTSVAKKPQDPEDAAAALTVITQEDIRRSGVTTLPEALRLAPGVEVAEIDGSITAVSVRGFNWRFSNKLLVLIDGRAIYQPTLSGIFWDQQQTPIEDIQRIEVVRGPGATMWGANAVNGVINVVTKHAADTLNGQATVETDGEDRQRAYLRYGLPIGDAGAIRLYGTFRETASLVNSRGTPYNAPSEATQFGFRMDLDPTAKDAVTLQGDIQSGRNESTLAVGDGPRGVVTETQMDEPSAHNILGRWVRTFSATNASTLQVYYDRVERSEFDADVEVSTYDIDFSHRFQPLDRADVVWGLAYRRTDDSIAGGSTITFTPDDLTSEWTSGFIQTEISAIPERLNFTLGTKLEHNSFTGFESQPTARFVWLGEQDWSLWGAVSQAVRTPSRVETGINVSVGAIPPNSPGNPTGAPLPLSLVGNPDFGVEKLDAYELGFRKSWPRGASLDIALYHQVYEKLQSIDIRDLPVFSPPTTGAPPAAGPPSAMFNPLAATFVNAGEGEISGVEWAVEVSPADWWDLRVIGEYREIELPLSQTGVDNLQGIVSQGESPTMQASVRSDFTISPDLDMSVTVRYVSDLDYGTVDAYTDLDVRTTWRATDKLELSLIGENLFEDRRREADRSIYPAPTGYVERYIALRAGLRF